MIAKRHKILQLIASSHGGGATHLLDLATLLSKKKFEVTVAMAADNGNVSPSQIQAAGSTFIPLPIHAGFDLSELKKLRGILQNNHFDLLHIHGARAGFYGRLAVQTLRHKPKVIFSIHGFATPYYASPKRQIYLSLERYFQRVTDHTICVAQAEQADFLRHIQVEEEKTSIIHPGIPLERFNASEIDSLSIQTLLKDTNSPIILIICRLNIPRDFETLLTAVALTKKVFPTLTLLIVGDGPLRGAVETKIKTLGLQSQVKLLGFRQDIPALLAAADIYTLTSSGWEGYPISTLEAQALGCPVVISDAGGAAEAVRHEQTGLVVPKHNPQALANAFCQLLNNEQLRKKLGENGRKRAKDLFSRETMVEKISAVYEQTLHL